MKSIKFLFILTFLILLVFYPVYVVHAAWTQRNLSNNTTSSQHPDIVCDSDGKIFVVWKETFGASNNIRAAKFDGITWTTNEVATGRQIPQWISASNRPGSTEVHVVWEDNLVSANGNIFFRSTNGPGNVWGTLTQVSTNPASVYAGYPAVASDSSGNIHVVWREYNSSNSTSTLYYRRGSNNGGTWSGVRRIAYESSGIGYRNARIAVSSLNNIHVVWFKSKPGPSYEVDYIRSTDNGNTWANRQVLSSAESVDNPEITSDQSGYLHAVWDENGQVFYRNSTNNGAAWSTLKEISFTPTPYIGIRPAVAVDNRGFVYVAWSDNRESGNSKVYFSKSTDNGANFGTPTILASTWIGSSALAPSLASDYANGGMHIAWQTPGEETWHAYESGSMSGNIYLDHSYPVSVEVVGFRSGVEWGRTVRTGPGEYLISGLPATWTFSIEANGPGYEIKNEIGATVNEDVTAEGVNVSLSTAWPMFRQDRWHTGNSPDMELRPPLVLKWSFPTTGGIKSSPAVLDGTVYVGTTGMHLFAVNTNGTLKWSLSPSINRPIQSSPVAADGKLYLPISTATASYMYAIDANGGSILWSFSIGPAGNDLPSSATLANGVLYVGAGEKVHAIYTSGIQKWSLSSGGPGSSIYSTPAVAEGTVYIGVNAGNKFLAIRDNGTVKWSFEADGFLQSSPAVVNGVVYVGSNDGNLYALKDNNDSYSLMWSFATGGAVQSSPAVANGVVYVGSNDSNLYAIEDMGGSYSVKWSFSTGGVVSSSPVLVNGFVYVGSGDNKLYIINSEDGTMNSSFETGEDVLSSPSVVNGIVYVGSNNGNLYSLRSINRGTIEGTVTLSPTSTKTISVEVVAFQEGIIKGSSIISITNSGLYTIPDLLYGAYSVEASAIGYEIKPYGSVNLSGSISSGHDITISPAWPEYQQDRRNTGNSPDTGITPPLQMKWSYNGFGFDPANTSIRSAPTVYDGKVYVKHQNGHVYAFAASGPSEGNLLISYAASSGLASFSPLIFDGKVYARGGSSIRCYEIGNNSSPLWSFNVAGSLEANMSVAYNNLYFGSRDNNVYALNAYTGGIVWSFPADGAIDYSIAVNNGRVFAGSADNSLYCLDSGTGDLVWSYNEGTNPFNGAMVDNNKVFAKTGSALYAFNENDGTSLWSYQLEFTDLFFGSPITGMALSDGKVYLTCARTYEVRVLDADSGSFLWSTNTGSSVSGSSFDSPDAPIISNGNVYFGGGSFNVLVYPGLFKVMDPENNLLLWSFVPFESYSDFGPASLHDGVLYVGSGNGALYAFESASATLEGGFQVTNLSISRESDSLGSSVILSWDPTTEVTVWATTEGYTSFEGWISLGNTTNSYFEDTNQVGTGEAEKYYKVVFSGVPLSAIGSADAVGKFNVTVEPGYSLISVPLNILTKDINDAIGNQLTGGIQANADAIYDRQGITSIYKKAYLNGSGTWTDAQTNITSTMEIDFTKGYFLQSKAATYETFTVVGEVLDDNLVTTLEAGYSLVGTVFPKDINPDSSGLELAANSGIQAVADALYSRIGITSVYNKAYFNTQWIDAKTGSPIIWKLDKGKGYFYQRRNTSMEWDREKPW